jgi:hypothetical protein
MSLGDSLWILKLNQQYRAFKRPKLLLKPDSGVTVHPMAFPEFVMTKEFERRCVKLAKKGMIIAVLKVVKKEMFQQADGPCRHYICRGGILPIDPGSGLFRWNSYVPP